MNSILRRATLAICLALGCIPLSWGAPAKDEQPQGQYPFDSLVNHADYIFQAECTDRTTVFENGNIYTKYVLKPSTVYKGRLPLDASGAVALSEIGGALPGHMPIAQKAPNMVGLSKGEEVLLFAGATSTPAGKSYKKDSALNPPMQILGGNQGRFSIVRDPETGEARVVRGAKYVYHKDSVRLGPNPVSPEESAKIEQTVDAAKKLRAASAKHSPAADEVIQFEPLADVEARLRDAIAADGQTTAP